MIEKIMKSLKRGNKKRGKNITIGAIVGFLLSCVSMTGADEYLWIRESGEKIEFNTALTSDAGGTGGNWSEIHPYSENSWDTVTKTYTNKMILSSNADNGKNNDDTDISYGLRLSGDLSDLNFINNSLITGIGTETRLETKSVIESKSSTGYGIYNDGTIKTLTNNVLIAGIGKEAENISTGYGIYNGGGISTLTNNGLIMGAGNTFGYGIYNFYGTINTLTNNGSIMGAGTETEEGKTGNGYGIYNGGEGIITDLTNSGLIMGTGKTSSHGIYNEKTITNLTNSGLIMGIGTETGTESGSNSYGISNGESITTLTNSGLITGTGNSGFSYGISSNNTLKELINNGSITGTGFMEGYGISFFYSENGTTLTNSGLIAGTGFGGFGYGISNNADQTTLTNSGLITGTGVIESHGIRNINTIKNLINNGSIIGTGNEEGNGYGISNIGYEITTLTTLINTGVIYGDTNAVKNDGGTITSANNYGILAAGEDVISNTGTITAENNYGMYIEKAEGKVTIGSEQPADSITIGVDEDGTEIKRYMTVKNAAIKTDTSDTETVSFTFTEAGENYDNSILNGKDKTLKVSGSNEIKGSIINAYETAVTFDNTTGGDLTLSETVRGELTLSGTIVNGGVDGASAISGSSNGDTLILQSGEIEYEDNTGTKTGTQNTIINGDISMGGGDDTLIIANGGIINGTTHMGDGNDILNIINGGKVNGILYGGEGIDTLNFNSALTRASSDDGINIQHNISGFENMNINTNVTLFEKTVVNDENSTNLQVTGAKNIIIGENGVLTLRIDTTRRDDNKIVGHALYGNDGIIKSENGGKLLFALNGAGNNSIISFGGLKLNNSLVTDHEASHKEYVTFATTSLLHSVKRIESVDDEVIITPKFDLPTDPIGPDNPNNPKDLKYEKLNQIYQSIISVDQLGNFNVDNNEKLSLFLGYLNDIYAGNPYSYSSELSRKSAGMFRDIVIENIFKPRTNKWMIYGGLTHIDGGTKDTYYGKGYYTYDIGSSNIEADTKITGAYMLGEYGVSDTLTAGVVLGGNKLEADISNGSKVDGDALYIGAYTKKYVGNLKLTAGVGFQYGDYDADRLAVNKVASSIGEPVMKYSSSYNDMTYDIYLNGRYSNPIGDNLFLEPYGTLSYTYVDQDGADEGNKVLAIETDSKSFNYTTAKVGVDLKKVIPHEKGKSTLSAGVSYTRILDGADEEHIKGRFKSGRDFDILVAHKNEHSIGLNAKYALELENGVLFDVKGTYAVERESNNNSGKNKTKGEWIVGAGLGYKF